MKINNQGCTRIVIILKNHVIKIPRFTYSWQHFLKGLLGNIQEHTTWKWNSGKHERGDSHLLCPVTYCSWGGWFLIMKRADVQKHIDEVHKGGKIYCYAGAINAGFGGDDKPDNYGYYEGRLVKVDYGS